MSGGTGGTSIDRHAAAFWARISGSAVDAVTVALVAAVVHVMIDGLGGLVLAGAIAFAYLMLPVACWGRTAGKLFARTRVVNARDGRRPSVRQAFERTALLVTPAVLTLVMLPFARPQANLFVFLMGVIAAGVYMSGLTREDAAGWHDIYANTVVVNSA